LRRLVRLTGGTGRSVFAEAVSCENLKITKCAKKGLPKTEHWQIKRVAAARGTVFSQKTVN